MCNYVFPRTTCGCNIPMMLDWCPAGLANGKLCSDLGSKKMDVDCIPCKERRIRHMEEELARKEGK